MINYTNNSDKQLKDLKRIFESGLETIGRVNPMMKNVLEYRLDKINKELKVRGLLSGSIDPQN